MEISQQQITCMHITQTYIRIRIMRFKLLPPSFCVPFWSAIVIIIRVTVERMQIAVHSSSNGMLFIRREMFPRKSLMIWKLRQIELISNPHRAETAYRLSVVSLWTDEHSNHNFDVTIMQTFWQIMFSHYMDYRSWLLCICAPQCLHMYLYKI